MDKYNSHICLDIPIPLSVQALPRIPPVSFPCLGDLISLEALRDFGVENGIPNDQIDQACNLASGPADIVVILERPNKCEPHVYGLPFPEFVRKSPALKAVDELIRFATKGARSIHTVTVLDAFSFKPNKDIGIPDLRCHQLLGQILRAKKPQVVMRCHRQAYEASWMKRFERPGEWDPRPPDGKYKYVRTEVHISEKHSAVLLHSFHPSVVLIYNELRPEFRCLYIYHFIAAFAELSGVQRLDKDAEEIRQLCNDKQNGETTPDLVGPDYLIRSFERRYGGPKRPARRIAAEKLPIMYDWLEYLAGPSRTFGALSIAQAVLHLWRKHFQTNPLYKQITALLYLRGSEQQGWFQTPDHQLPVAEELSKLQISNSAAPGGTTMGLYPPEIVAVNQRAISYISNALAMGELKGVADTRPQPIHDELAKLIGTQSSLVDEYIRTFSMAQLSRALKIKKLETQCTNLINFIRGINYALFADAGENDDLSLLRNYLQRLISL